VDGNVRTGHGEFGIIEELIVSVDPELRRVATTSGSRRGLRTPPLVMRILRHPTRGRRVLSWSRSPARVGGAEFASGMDGAVESIKQSLA